MTRRPPDPSGSDADPVAEAQAASCLAPETDERDYAHKARWIHEHTLVLDTHVDFSPATLTGRPNYTQRLETQLDLPKMIEGGMDALFLIVYVGQTREAQNPAALTAAGYEPAYKLALEKFDAVDRFVHEIASDQIELALTSQDVRRLRARGKRAALIGVENGYPLGEDIARVREFHERGARYLSLAHNGHNQLSDSHTGEREGWKWNGLSPLGKEVIAAMNRFGVITDVSHASKASMMQTAALSRAPIIASHSAIRALCDVSRNLDDEQLLALKKTGGVIQIVAYGDFIKPTRPDSAERKAALAAVRKSYNLPDPGGFGQSARLHAALKQISSAQRADYEQNIAAVDARYPGDPPASVKDLVDHIDYAVSFLGIDHVGIASDFDGGGGIDGWRDASETFNVTLELVRRGYGQEQIEKLWGGNLLRVLDEVQRVASASQ